MKIRGGKFQVTFTPSVTQLTDPEVLAFRFRFTSTLAEIEAGGVTPSSLYDLPYLELPKAEVVSFRVPYDLPPNVLFPLPVAEKIYLAITTVDDVGNESDALAHPVPFDVVAPAIPDGVVRIDTLDE